MNLQDVLNMIDEPEAADKLFELFRQGITNAAAIPEIQTEPDMAAHHLLGCDNYLALLAVYDMAESYRVSDGVPDSVADVVKAIADVFLRDLAESVVMNRGPLGTHHCDQGAASE